MTSLKISRLSYNRKAAKSQIQVRDFEYVKTSINQDLDKK